MNNTGFVYKLVCKDINVKECYVGSTGNTRIRKAHHKSDCNNVNGKNFNFRVYQYIRENDGFQNWELIVLETVQYNQKFELRARERHHMELLGATLNSQVPNRTSDEWHLDNAENVQQQKKQHYQDNAEKIKQQVKQYRGDNLEHIKQHKKQYYENNHEQIKQQHKQYRKDNAGHIKQHREDNKEQINQKHNCECGGKYTNANKACHEKTQKHQKHLEQ